jgi:pimeloyl-ACP methyl ester carboxylesterase
VPDEGTPPVRYRGGEMRLCPALTVLAAFVGAAGAAPAEAAIPWAPCAPAGFACGALIVPLDRTGAVPGTVTLQARLRPATAGPARTAVVALAGGPGQAAMPAAGDFAELLAPALGARDLLVFDQRGTGASGRLRCRALEQARGSLASVVGGCARELGPGRGLYRTADSVADLEDLRAAAGYEKLALVGFSYGTKVALDYAAAHPDRVESLVLDSVVPPEGPDVLNRSSLSATGRVLADLCARRACRAITSRPLHDLRELVRRTGRRALDGWVNGPRGHRVRAELTPFGLFDVLTSGDVNPALRAELPGAVRSALGGDPQPILRLGARAGARVGVPVTRAQAAVDENDSDALFLATRCEESLFPWPRAAAPALRIDRAIAAARAIPPAQLGPFTWTVALASEAILPCLAWPNAAPAPAPPGPLPAVPALLLSGRGDVRTPLQNARAVAARIPGSTLLAVAFTGHSVLGSDFSRCSRAALAGFFAGAAVKPCGAVREVFRPVAPAPRRLSGLAGSSPASRTLSAALATVRDVRRQLIGDALAGGVAPGPGARTGGLRGGFAVQTPLGLELRRVVYVPGVVVSGFYATTRRASSRLAVTGSAAARGTVRISARGRVRAVLGGHRVSRRVAVAAAAGAGPAAWPERALPHGRLARLG